MDVTLTLTDDEVYRMTIDSTNVDDYTRYFKERVLANPDIRMHIARISVAPDSFLTEMYAVNYVLDRTLPLDQYNTLKTRKTGVLPSKLLFNLNRSSDWGKNVFWSMQKWYFARQQDGAIISRNNAMRSESQFMEYREAERNDLLQEYFIPVEEFAAFVKDMRSVLRDKAVDLNLLNITVRYVNEDREAVLSYAQEDMFALVCLFNVPLSEQGQSDTARGIRLILDQVICHHGTYYCPMPLIRPLNSSGPSIRGTRSFGRRRINTIPSICL